MRDISIAIAAPFRNKYLPMIKNLGDSICCCYGVGYPRNYRYTDEPLDKMKLTKLTSRTSAFIIKPATRVFRLPGYYTYLSNVVMFDRLVCKQISRDSSKVVFLNPLLCNTAEECKKRRKTVVCEAGNSEPNREYARIDAEYEQFGIKHRYIYGDTKYKERVNRSFEVADSIITISNISNQTYLDAGYAEERLHLISLAGTDFQRQTETDYQGKEQAFITTAFHSFIKGTHRLLLAWRRAGIQGKRLYIVGNLHEDMKEFVQREGPFDNVVFVGHRNDLDDWYKRFDAVGILLSLSEGAGRVTPEMMSFGFPMITSSDASCDLIRDSYNGSIVDPLRLDEVTEALRYFADDWSRVHAMRKNALDSVAVRTVKDFSIELGNYLVSLA